MKVNDYGDFGCCAKWKQVCLEELPLELAKWKQRYVFFTFVSTWFLLELVLGSTIICYGGRFMCKLHKWPGICGNHVS